MPEKIIYTATRPTIDTPWYTWPKPIADHTNSLYRETGKIIDRGSTISEDQLTMSGFTVWQDGAFDEWVNDPVAREGRIDQNIHNLEHNIVTTSTRENI
jgi:hypothetical protein